MRFFITLEIPEESKHEISKVQHQIKQLIPEARLTDTDKLHVTIAFVGEEPDQLKHHLIDIMNDAVSGIPPFTVTPAYIDGFPTIHHPRVIWVGVKGEIDKLFVIRERIKDGLIRLQLNVDERRFVPHIAIAKTKTFELTPEVEEKMQEMMMDDFASITVSSIKLFESIPNHGFHQHNTLAEIQLIESITL